MKNVDQLLDIIYSLEGLPFKIIVNNSTLIFMQLETMIEVIQVSDKVNRDRVEICQERESNIANLFNLLSNLNIDIANINLKDEIHNSYFREVDLAGKVNLIAGLRDMSNKYQQRYLHIINNVFEKDIVSI